MTQHHQDEGFPFTPDQLRRIAQLPMQAAGTALLSLAQRTTHLLTR